MSKAEEQLRSLIQFGEPHEIEGKAVEILLQYGKKCFNAAREICPFTVKGHTGMIRTYQDFKEYENE